MARRRAQFEDPHTPHYRANLDLAGYSWSIECAATPNFVAQRRTLWPSMTLTAGMIFTAMLAAYIMLSIDRRAYAERLVHEKRLYARGLEAKVNERTEALRLPRRRSSNAWFPPRSGATRRPACTSAGRVSSAKRLAKAAGWSAAEAEILRLAAPMHDVGKIGIPDAILRKPGKLTHEEFDVIKMHSLIGAEMLANSKVPILQMAHEIALCHHEWWDGTGYPSRLAGLNIPESARIVAIADVFDALSHDRVYRKALPEDEVVETMQRESETHFDPSLMALFLLILPEFERINRENPDGTRADVSLIRAFAATVACSNAGEVGAALPLSGSPS